MNVFDVLRRQRFLSFTVVLFTLAVGVLIGTLFNTGVKAAKDATIAPGATPLTVPSPVQLQNSFSKLAKMLEPSVVNISSEYIPKRVASDSRPLTQQRRRQVPQPQDGEEGGDMNDFFRRFFGSPMGPGPQEQQKGASLGSGFVVDANGYILTNNHVVEKATRIHVKFANDPNEYDAKVIGTDGLSDLAVIKIDKTNLIPAHMGNSDGMQVGDWAVAIGSPFGFQATVTAGIISAKSRDTHETNSNFQHFLQTDAAINPGNSGGPLLNINGEVIGINTQIASRTGGYQGIGFAVPSNIAVKVYNQIIKTGHVTRGSIGVRFQEGSQTRDLLRAYKTDGGVFIQQITPGGPAEKGGLKDQDIITKVDGKPVRNGSDLIDIVADTPVGTSISVEYLRDGKPRDTRLVIADRAKLFANDESGSLESQQDDSEGPETPQTRFGIRISNLQDRMRDNWGIKEDGIVVNSVEPNSFAADIGLEQGDVITALNRQPVKSADEFVKLQARLKAGDAVALRVLHNDGSQDRPKWTPRFVAGTIPASN